MDTYSGKTPHAVSVNHSGWGDDAGSTVGFARLQDEEGILTPKEIQRSVYGAGPVGSAVTTTTGEDRTRKVPLSTGGILKESTIDQHTEIIR